MNNLNFAHLLTPYLRFLMPVAAAFFGSSAQIQCSQIVGRCESVFQGVSLDCLRLLCSTICCTVSTAWALVFQA